MPSKTAPVRGSDKAKTGREASSRKGNNASSSIYARQSKAIPKWNVTEYKPPRKISDKELTEARKMFFEMDRDGSGSIDAEELGMMLRSLGQNPSDQELKELIDSVDEGDKDGQIQLREFLKLYTQSLDGKTSGQAGKEDCANVFAALGVRNPRPRPRRRAGSAARHGCHAPARASTPTRLPPAPRQGDPKTDGTSVEKRVLHELLKEEYDLDLDLDGEFIGKGETLTKVDFENFLMAPKA